MKTISEIMWLTMSGTYKKLVENICNDYETNPKYHLKKVYENDDLVGFFCYYDTAEYRMLEAGYYVGNNRCMALKAYRWAIGGARIVRALVQKPNEKIWKAYLRLGFKIIGEDLNNILLEKAVK